MALPAPWRSGAIGWRRRAESHARRFAPLARQAVGTGIAQSAVQGLNLLSGLIVIRSLPQDDYARYALTFGVLGTLAVLADAGVSAGVMAQAGRTWPDPVRAAAAVRAGLRARTWLAAAAAVVVLPLLGALLWRHGTSPMQVAVLLLAVAAGISFGTTTAVWEVPPKLAGDLRRLQGLQFGGAIVRLVLIVVTAAWNAAATTLTLAGVVAQCVAAAWTRRLAVRHLAPAPPADPEASALIRRLVMRSLPGALYFCLAGQITLWLASVLGSTSTVADLGALQRLALVLTPIGSMIGLVVVPRFARLRGDASECTRRYVQVQFAVALLGATLVAVVAVAPGAALWLLGPAYAGLRHEVVMLAAVSAVGMVAATAFALNNARGVSAPGWVSPAISTVLIVIAAVVFDLGTVRGALALSALLNVASVLMFNATFLHALQRSPG